MTEDPYQLRFSGIARLYGSDALTILSNSHLCVVGIGGVGSWSAEALARSGVGRITLVDMDDICISNTNRQIHTAENTLGKSKAAVMAERIRGINPECQVHAHEDFFTATTADEILSLGFDGVIDAIDSLNSKCELLYRCLRAKIPLVAVGGAGGKTDPTRIQTCDLLKSYKDPLLAQVRKRLRQQYNFSRNPKRRFRIEVVFSPEEIVYPSSDGTVCSAKPKQEGGESMRLDCQSGYGAVTHITATFGMVAAASLIKKVIAKQHK